MSEMHTKFLDALAKDFDANGEGVIERCRVESPSQYLSIIERTMPKEFRLETKNEDTSAVSADQIIQNFLDSHNTGDSE